MFKKISIAAVALTMATAAHSAPVTFFGENLTPGATVTGAPVTAQTSFLATLSGGVGTEDFESATLPAISFPGSTGAITANLTGGGSSIVSSPGAGRFATSGSSYVQTTGGGDFTVTFSSAIAAFGFFGTDIGDIGNSLVLQLTDTLNNITQLAVGNTVGATSGSLLYFGFIDTATSYTQIKFLNQPGGGDIFGFDDMTIGDTAQIVNPPAVPLPAAAWLLLGALGGLGAMKRRKKSA